MKKNLHFIRFILLGSVIVFSIYAHSSAERSVTRTKERNKREIHHQYNITSRDTSFMKQAIAIGQLTRKNSDDNSTGCIMVMNNEVIGEGWDKVLSDNDPTAHAEIEAVRAAGKNLKKLFFKGSVLYTTRQPCAMCISVLAEVGLKVIYYLDVPENSAYKPTDETRENRNGHIGTRAPSEIPLQIEIAP